MIDITHKPLDAARLLEQVRSPLAGAVLVFMGTTREWTSERQTRSLDYECYEAMARRTLEDLEAEARQRWELVDCAIAHRVGNVAPGESSVVVAVSSPHRDDAFLAGRWLIDTLKDRVPIWKKENWADGTAEWVHPGLPSTSNSAQPDNA